MEDSNENYLIFIVYYLIFNAIGNFSSIGNFNKCIENWDLIYLKNSKIVISIFYIFMVCFKVLLVNLISKCVITVCKIILYLILINKFQYIEKLSSIFSLFNIIRILSLSFKNIKILSIVSRNI